MKGKDSSALKAFYFFIGVMSVVCAVAYMHSRQVVKELAEELPPPVTPEERQFVREAHRVGTRLYSVGKRAAEATPDREQQQIRLQPVYRDVEELILKRLSPYSHRISSIRIIYHIPDLECSIVVKEGPEDELTELKRIADRCVGRIVENLPMVKYLIVKRDDAPSQAANF